MDTVTQALLGAAIADAGFRRRLGPRAVLLGAACGILPDLDLVSALAGPWASLLYHRGPTHSLFVLTLLAPWVGLLASRAWGQAGSWQAWGWLAWLALGTHPLLDVCTSYGTQILWPFTDHRFAIDAIGILDPVYTLLLLLALLLNRIRRIRLWSGPNVSVIALALSTAYLGLGFGISQYQITRFTGQLEAEGREVAACRAMPMPLSLLVWRQVALDREGNLFLEVSSLLTARGKPPLSLRRQLSPYRGEWMGEVAARPEGRLFLWFSGGYRSVSEEKDGAETILTLADQRYGSLFQPERSPFGARVVFAPDGRIRSFERTRSHGALSRELRGLWLAMRGIDPREVFE